MSRSVIPYEIVVSGRSGRGMRHAQHGLTLIELMISITLGMAIVAAGLMVLVSTKSTYVIQDENTRLSDTGRYAIENISRAVRQAAFENLESEDAPIVHDPDNAANAPNIDGFDAKTMSVTTGSLTPLPGAMTVNPSDILQVRFFGASKKDVSGTPTPDGSIINCAGRAVGAVQTPENANEGRGWSIFFVHRANGGEPQLFCAYVDGGKLVSAPIASGVESFQVLYGLDTNNDGVPEQFLNATDVKNRWRNVVALKIAMLVRSGRSERADVEDKVYDLFGPAYDEATDKGSRVSEAALPQAERARTRKIFSTLIQLRNRASGANIAPIQ